MTMEGPHMKVIKMEKGIITTTIKEIQGNIKQLQTERIESETTIKESHELMQRLKDPILALNQDLDHLRTITVATGETKPADLKKAENRLETVQKQYEDAENTITTLEARLKEIDRELKHEHDKKGILLYFQIENKKINLALKALFEGLTDNERSNLKEMIGVSRNFLSKPQISPNTIWALNRTMKAASEGKEHYKFY